MERRETKKEIINNNNEESFQISISQIFHSNYNWIGGAVPLLCLSLSLFHSFSVPFKSEKSAFQFVVFMMILLFFFLFSLSTRIWIGGRRNGAARGACQQH